MLERSWLDLAYTQQHRMRCGDLRPPPQRAQLSSQCFYSSMKRYQKKKIEQELKWRHTCAPTHTHTSLCRVSTLCFDCYCALCVLCSVTLQSRLSLPLSTPLYSPASSERLCIKSHWNSNVSKSQSAQLAFFCCCCCFDSLFFHPPIRFVDFFLFSSELSWVEAMPGRSVVTPYLVEFANSTSRLEKLQMLQSELKSSCWRSGRSYWNWKLKLTAECVSFSSDEVVHFSFFLYVHKQKWNEIRSLHRRVSFFPPFFHLLSVPLPLVF